MLIHCREEDSELKAICGYTEDSYYSSMDHFFAYQYYFYELMGMDKLPGMSLEFCEDCLNHEDLPLLMLGVIGEGKVG